MTIVWNKVTWYSKLLAALFFIFVMPVLAFYIGNEYGSTKQELKQDQSAVLSPTGSTVMPIPPDVQAQNDSALATPLGLTGVSGVAMLGPKCSAQTTAQNCSNNPYFGTLEVYGNDGKTVTQTKTRTDGKFVLFLDPGTYAISLPPSNEPFPKMAPAKISITKNSLAHITLNIDSGAK
jgi:hypothetical protein